MMGGRIELVADVIANVSDEIAGRVRELRRREGMPRDEVASAARAAGAPATFTAVALGNVETGRRDKDGRRRREVTVDELVALARAFGRSPLELLGDHAVLFGAEAVDCARCEGHRGEVEARVRLDMSDLAELTGIEASLAAIATRLAEAIDTGGGEGGKQLPQLAQQLRATLEAIAAGRRAEQDPDDDDDDLADLDEPD